MKIKKEFVDLIYNGEKKYEFRNSCGKAGFYKIRDKYFELKYVGEYYSYEIKKKKTMFDSEFNYFFCEHKITNQEYEWIKNNIDYFGDEIQGTYVVVYEWLVLDIKELEVVE